MVRKLIVVFLLVLLIGCTSDNNDNDNERPKEIDRIDLNSNDMTLIVGDFSILSVLFTPSDSDDKQINWTSSNPKVATVIDGKVTAVSVGEAVIRAETTNGKVAQCNIKVKRDENVSSIKDVYITYETEYLAVNFIFANLSNATITTDANIKLNIVNKSNKQIYEKDFSIKKSNYVNDIISLRINYEDMNIGENTNDDSGLIYYQISTPTKNFSEQSIATRNLPVLGVSKYELLFNQTLPMPIVYAGASYTARGRIETISYLNHETNAGFYIEFSGEITKENANNLYIDWDFIMDGYVVRSISTIVPNIGIGKKFKVGTPIYFPPGHDEYSTFEIEITNIDKSQLP